MKGGKERLTHRNFMGMGQALSWEIHRQYYPCGIRRGLPDGAPISAWRILSH